MKFDKDAKTPLDLAELSQNKNIKIELEKAIEGVEIPNEDSDSDQDDNVLRTTNDHINLKTEDDDLLHTPTNPGKLLMSPRAQQEYIQQMKNEWDVQYQKELNKKEEKLNSLKHVVVDQDKVIKEMQEQLKTIDEKHKQEYETEIKKLKLYMKQWKK